MSRCRPRTTGLLTLALLLLLQLAWTVPAHGRALTTTVENFAAVDPTGTSQPYGVRALKVDVRGDAVDAHAGNIRWFEGRYHRYGEVYSCPFSFDAGAALVDPTKRSGPPCGFRSYSSTDLVHWRNDGPLIADLPQRTRTPGDILEGGNGYFSTVVTRDPRTRRYVMWFNTVRLPGDQRPSWYTAVSASPSGPFTQVRAARLSVEQGGDYDIFVDDDGTGWIVHVAATPPFSLRVQRLTADLRSGSGAATVVTANAPDTQCPERLGCTVGFHEAPSLFRRGTTYYLLSGEACAFCWASSGYYTAPSPAGPWTGAGGAPSLTGPTTKIHPASCGGQPRRVDVLPGAAGPLYLLQVDLWNSDAVNAAGGGFGYPQQGLAGYFWAPLSFDTAGRLRPLTCDRKVRLALAVGVKSRPARPAGTDIDPGITGLRAACPVSAGAAASQDFTAGRTGVLRALRLNLFRYEAPDAPVTLTVRRGTAAEPGRVLASVARAPAGVSYSPRLETVRLRAAVRRGERLHLTMSSPSTRGCFGTAVTDADRVPGGRLHLTPDSLAPTPALSPDADIAIRTVVSRPVASRRPARLR